MDKFREKEHPLSWFLQCIGLSSKSWYRKERQHKDQDDPLWKERIEDVLASDEGYSYGYVRVAYALRRKGYTINKKKTHRIMKKYGLLQKRRKRTVSTTNSAHGLPTYPNLVKGLTPTRPHEIWAADITYVRLPKGFCYVALITDIFTRKIVGWSVKETMATELCMEALEMALSKGVPAFHHSDRGVQYASREYTERLKANNVRISMADKGMSVDNPYAESVNGKLKVEKVYLSEYETVDDAGASIGHFIESVYNTKRLHSSLGYVPPEEFEREWLKKNEDSVSLKVLAER